MKYPGMTIFVLFFGISLLDALWGGDWLLAFFWVGMGLAFFTLERRAARRAPKTESSPP